MIEDKCSEGKVNTWNAILGTLGRRSLRYIWNAYLPERNADNEKERIKSLRSLRLKGCYTSRIQVETISAKCFPKLTKDLSELVLPWKAKNNYALRFTFYALRI